MYVSTNLPNQVPWSQHSNSVPTGKGGDDGDDDDDDSDGDGDGDDDDDDGDGELYLMFTILGGSYQTTQNTMGAY